MEDENQEKIDNALSILAAYFGDEVWSIPISVDPDLKHTACISTNGITLRPDSLLDGGLYIYIAHEIFHPVVQDLSILHKFDRDTINRAEDYKINGLLFKLYGFDVRKSSKRGLFKRKFIERSVEQIAKSLSKEGPVTYEANSYTDLALHPSLRTIVNRLRKELGFDTCDYLTKNKVNQVFEKEMVASYSELHFSNLPNVNIDAVMHDLWVRWYTVPEFNLKYVKKTLTHSQVLSLVPDIVTDCQNDSVLATFSARKILTSYDSAYLLINGLISELSTKRDNKEFKLQNCESQRRYFKRLAKKGGYGSKTSLRNVLYYTDRMASLRKSIKKLKKRIEYLSSLPDLKSLLIESPTVSSRKKAKPKTLTSQSYGGVEIKFDRSEKIVEVINLVLDTVLPRIQ